jgi:tripartite-type tricarboxylate transporter receptor subunit TctC
MKRSAIYFLGFLLAAPSAVAQDAPSFQGKRVNMIIGFAVGGGTDAYGRLVATYLGKYLPGSPTVVVRNVPGADGTTAMNYLVEQVVPDGNTITMASNSSADPANYRKAQAKFNPLDFAVIGGAGRGGEVLLINKDTQKRLHDKEATPVIMGALGGVPRSGMVMTAWGIEYLGWNAKWVVGYRGTNELMLALERGEIDMTSTGNLFLIQKLVDTGKFSILVQTGMLKNGVLVSRADFGNAPVFAKMIDGKITDTVARKAFEYWSDMAVTDKWLALPPKSPKPVVEVYRQAYSKVIQDPEFIDRGRKISDDIQPMLSADVEPLIRRLADVPPDAIEHIANMLRKQGVPTE